jgi:predicted DNA-binding protein
MLKTKKKGKGEKKMKLASEKCFNRAICPVMNIKGKTVKYPLTVKHKTFGFRCDEGILGPKNMMIMDIIGTMLIHVIYGNNSFADRIPTPKDIRVRKISAECMSYKLLNHVTKNIAASDEGKIRESWYSQEGNLCEVDKNNPRIKKVQSIIFNDGVLRKELPFLRKYSSVQIQKMILQTSHCILQLNYPIRFFNGKEYQMIPFDNYNLPSKLFTVIEIKNTKISKDNHILEREYKLRLNTILGYMFMQNIASCYMDLLPGKFYEMSDYAQLFYRLFILTYFPNKKSGKSPKNPVSLEEIRNRLVLKTPDSYMVRKIVNRILKELEDYKFISAPKEEKIYGAYMYSYKKNTWKDITGEEETTETDLDFIGN